MSLPADLLFTAHDEWVRRDGDVLTIGITDFAQDQLGEICHVEMPEVGATMSAGDEVCEIESTKTVASVYAPADCEVVEVNEGLDGEEAMVNDDPYGTGWLFKVRVAADADLSGLLDAAAYEAKVAS